MSVSGSVPTSILDFVSSRCSPARRTLASRTRTSRRAATRFQYARSTAATVSATVRRSDAVPRSLSERRDPDPAAGGVDREVLQERLAHFDPEVRRVLGRQEHEEIVREVAPCRGREAHGAARRQEGADRGGPRVALGWKGPARLAERRRGGSSPGPCGCCTARPAGTRGRKARPRAATTRPRCGTIRARPRCRCCSRERVPSRRRARAARRPEPQARAGAGGSSAATGNATTQQSEGESLADHEGLLSSSGRGSRARAQARLLEAGIDGLGEALEERALRREERVPLGLRQLDPASGQLAERPQGIPAKFPAKLLVRRKSSEYQFHAFLGHGSQVSRPRSSHAVPRYVGFRSDWEEVFLRR